MTTTTPLTDADILRGYEDERWLGWGYLGERERLRNPEKADARLLAHANSHGWDYARLFAFLNSKPGRWYGDLCADEAAGYPAKPEHVTALFSDDLGEGLIP